MRRSVAALTLLAGVFAAAAPAAAHEELALRALPVIDSIEPAVEGVEFRVLQLTAPALVVENSTDLTVVIPDGDGIPFLKVGPGGVAVNSRSAYTYRSFDPDGHATVPEGLDPDAPPRWVELAEEPTWTWFDPRLAFDPARPEWTIETEVDGRPVVISGSYEPLEGHGHFRARLATPPEIADLELRVIDGPVPGIFVRNSTGSVLEVPGRDDEAFLRIGPRGVFANLMSPSWYMGGSQAIEEVPRWVDPAAAPRWKKVSAAPVWAWLEHRAALPFSAHVRGSLGSEPADVVEWSTTLSLGGDPLELRGVVRWIPPRSAHSDPVRRVTWWPSAAAAGIVLAAGGALRLKRRSD